MGSKTKTVSDLQAVNMFENEDNLFSQELIRIYARTGTLDASRLLPPLLNDSITFFNDIVFETMGATIDLEMNILEYTDDAILSYVQTIDPTATEVTGNGMVDSNDTPVDGDILKIKDLLAASYTPVSGYGQTLYQTLTFTTTGNYEVVYSAYDVIGETLTVDVENNSPVTRTSPTTEQVEVRMTNADTAAVVWVEIANDVRSVIAIEYLSGATVNRMYAFNSDMIGEAETQTGFLLLMKKDFSMVGDPESSERKFLYSRFGLNAKDKDGNTLEDSLDVAEMKDAFLTYATDRYDDEFGYLVNRYYTGSDVTVVGDISFLYSTSMGIGGSGTEYQIEYDGVWYDTDQADADGRWMPFYIIPLEAIKTMPMHQRFEVYNKMFSMFVFSQTEVEVKWYQSVWFRAVMMIVAIVLSVVTAGMSVSTAVAMQVAMTIGGYILSLIDPRIMAVIGIVVAIISYNPNQIMNSVLNIASNVLKVVSEFHNYAFMSDMELIKQRTQEYYDDAEELEEEASEDFKKPLVINFSAKVEYAYNGLYDLAYNMPDMLANSVNPEKLMPQYA